MGVIITSTAHRQDVADDSSAARQTVCPPAHPAVDLGQPPPATAGAADQLLRMLREWHRALVRSLNEDELLGAACRIVAEVGGFAFARIVAADSDSAQALRVLADSGPFSDRTEDAFPTGEAIRSNGTDAWHRAVSAAISASQPCVLDEMVSTADRAIVANEPQAQQPRALCALPLRGKDGCLGVLLVGASGSGAFDQATVSVLEELGEGLVFGLAARQACGAGEGCATVAAPVEADSGLFFDSNPWPMWIYDLQTLAFLAVNDAAVVAYGYTREEFLALTILDVCLLDQAPLLGDDVVGVEDGIADSGIWQHIRKDGRLLEVEVTASRIMFRGRTAELSLIDDITARRRTEAALIESEINYRQLVENANSIILRWTPQGEITFINDFGLRFFGYAHDELIGRHVVGTIVPADRPGGQDLGALMEEICREPDRFEHNVNQNIRANGERVWVAWTNRAVLDEHGRVTELFSVGADISARKLAEDRLAESEARYYSLFETAPDAIVILDRQTHRVLNVNRAACRLYGYTRDEFVRLLPEDVPARVERIITNGSLDEGGAPIYARWEKRKDGTIFLVEIETGFFEQGGREAVVVFIRDVTEQKRAEEALRLTQFSVDHSSEAAYWMSADGRLIYVNQAACEAVGYSHSELLQMSISEIDPVFPPERWAAHWRELRDRRHMVFESTHRRRDGSSFPVEIRANLIEFGGKEYNCALARDISERKRAEAQLRRYREHLEDLVAERTNELQCANRELRQAMAQLVQAEKLAALGSLVAGVAHELNTPLGNSRVVASLLGEQIHELAAAFELGSLRRSQVEGFLQRGREAVELLERNAARAADLISQFKQVAVDQSSVRRRTFDLRQTVDDILVALRPRLKRTQHGIDVDIPNGLELDSYPGPLEQVIVNLVDNALAHGLGGHKPGRIEFKAHAHGSAQLVLRVSDDGAGIPATILRRVFEPFFTTRLGQGGSGLGLYIVYNLVTGVLGGNIDVESTPGQGTTFVLTLPRRAPEGSAGEPALPER